MLAGTGVGAVLVIIALVALAAMSVASTFDHTHHGGGSPNN